LELEGKVDGEGREYMEWKGVEGKLRFGREMVWRGKN
jgi:hypothetical protein